MGFFFFIDEMLFRKDFIRVLLRVCIHVYIKNNIYVYMSIYTCMYKWVMRIFF